MKSKIVNCVDCGKEFPRKELNRNLRCSDCAWKKLKNTMTQLQEKSGPEYEKWRKQMVEIGIPRQIAALKHLQAKLARTESQF